MVGQFLEHHRIFYFYNQGKEDVYLSSADWMDRNLFRRIEVAFPILDPMLKQRVMDEGLNELLKDTSSWMMNSNGTYHQPPLPVNKHKLMGQKKLLAQYNSAPLAKGTRVKSTAL